jgi:hypothetical protein
MICSRPYNLEGDDHAGSVGMQKIKTNGRKYSWYCECCCSPATWPMSNDCSCQLTHRPQFGAAIINAGDGDIGNQPKPEKMPLGTSWHNSEAVICSLSSIAEQI